MSDAARLGEPSNVISAIQQCQQKFTAVAGFSLLLSLGELTERLEADSEFPAPNEPSVSRTAPHPSSQTDQVVLFLPLSDHEQPPADRLIERDPRLRIRNAPIVDVDPA